MFSHCSLVGHIKDKCYKLHGYRPGHKKNQVVENVSETKESSSSTNESTTIQAVDWFSSAKWFIATVDRNTRISRWDSVYYTEKMSSAPTAASKIT